MAERIYRTGSLEEDEEVFFRRVSKLFKTPRDTAWSNELCLELVQYVPMRYLNYYLKTRSGWTKSWMHAVEAEVFHRNLFKTRYKKLPKDLK